MSIVSEREGFFDDTRSRASSLARRESNSSNGETTDILTNLRSGLEPTLPSSPNLPVTQEIPSTNSNSLSASSAGGGSHKDAIIRLFMNNDNPVVDLSHEDMSSSNIFKLCQCLKNQKLSGKKTEFNLSLCSIDPKKFALLYEAFSSLSQEFSLILNFNSLSDISSLTDIKRIFNDLVKLKRLSLDGTRLGDRGITELSTHLPMTKSLTYLSLESNRLGLDSMVAIGKLLPMVPSLQTIVLRDNDLSDEKSVQVLCTGVCQSHLQSLNLEMTHLQPLAIRHIGSLLSQSRTLTSLDLSSNHLLPLGMRFLADGLRENLTLVSLRIAGCFIGVAGLTNLTAGLVDNDTLRSLDVSRIHGTEEAFGEEGAKPIADMLTLNRGITNLNLYWQCLGTKGAIRIAVALDSNRTIRTLNLGGNYIAPEGVRRLETALGLSEKLANDRPISSWLGSAPLTPLLLNRSSASLRRLSLALSSRHGSATVSRANSFNNGGAGSLSRGNSFNNSPALRSARGSFRDRDSIAGAAGGVSAGGGIPRLSTTPRGDSAGTSAAVWIPLSPNHEAMKNRTSPLSQRNQRNTITDPQARRRSTQFFESAFTGGATDDFLSRRSPTAAAAQQQQFGALSSKRRGSNFPQLSTGGSTINPPLLSASILPPALQGISSTTGNSSRPSK